MDPAGYGRRAVVGAQAWGSAQACSAVLVPLSEIPAVGSDANASVYKEQI